MHSQEVRLGLSDEVGLEADKVWLLDQIRLSLMILDPVEELVEIGTHKWGLRVPLVVNDFSSVDEPENRDDSAD